MVEVVLAKVTERTMRLRLVRRSKRSLRRRSARAEAKRRKKVRKKKMRTLTRRGRGQEVEENRIQKREQEMTPRRITGKFAPLKVASFGITSRRESICLFPSQRRASPS